MENKTFWDIKNIDGIWIKYEEYQLKDLLGLSLENYSTGWDIVNNRYGSIHIYYSQDSFGNMSVPRAYIVEGLDNDFTGKIRKVQGIDHSQVLNLDIYIHQIVQDKLYKIKGKSIYFELVKFLGNARSISEKITKKESLIWQDLNFIYRELPNKVDNCDRLFRHHTGFSLSDILNNNNLAEVLYSRNISEDIITILNNSDKLFNFPKEKTSIFVNKFKNLLNSEFNLNAKIIPSSQEYCYIDSEVQALISFNSVNFELLQDKINLPKILIAKRVKFSTSDTFLDFFKKVNSRELLFYNYLNIKNLYDCCSFNIVEQSIFEKNLSKTRIYQILNKVRCILKRKLLFSSVTLNFSELSTKVVCEDLNLVNNTYILPKNDDDKICNWSNSQIKTFTRDKNIFIFCEKSLDLNNSELTELPENIFVNGDINLSHSKIQLLGWGEKFVHYYNLNLSNTNLTQLPNTLLVRKNLYLNNTNIQVWPQRFQVNGNLYLKKSIINCDVSWLRYCVKGKMILS